MGPQVGQQVIRPTFIPSADTDVEMTRRAPLTLNRPTTTSPFFSILAKVWRAREVRSRLDVSAGDGPPSARIGPRRGLSVRVRGGRIWVRRTVTGTELPEGTGSKGGQAVADAYGTNYTGDLAFPLLYQ